MVVSSGTVVVVGQTVFDMCSAGAWNAPSRHDHSCECRWQSPAGVVPVVPYVRATARRAVLLGMNVQVRRKMGQENRRLGPPRIIGSWAAYRRGCARRGVASAVNRRWRRVANVADRPGRLPLVLVLAVVAASGAPPRAPSETTRRLLGPFCGRSRRGGHLSRCRCRRLRRCRWRRVVARLPLPVPAVLAHRPLSRRRRVRAVREDIGSPAARAGKLGFTHSVKEPFCPATYRVRASRVEQVRIAGGAGPSIDPTRRTPKFPIPEVL